MPIESANVTLFKGKTAMFAFFLCTHEKFANQIKCQKFDIEDEGQGHGAEKRDLRHSTGNVRFSIGVFHNFIYQATYVYGNGSTYRCGRG